MAKSLGYEFGYLDLSTEEFEEMGFTVAKNDQGNNDWFDLKAYEYFSTNLPVYTDGTNEYVSIWKWDEEAGTSFQYFYTFKPVPGIDGLVRNLEASEILEQVYRIEEETGERTDDPEEQPVTDQMTTQKRT